MTNLIYSTTEKTKNQKSVNNSLSAIKKFLLMAACVMIYASQSFGQAPYCVGTANCAASDHIVNVTLSTLNNTSGACLGSNGNTAFSDYTGLTPPNLTAGNTYTISVSVNNGGSTEYAGTWIDYDHSNTLDAAEFINMGTPVLSTNYISTATFTVPLTATPGLTRLRCRSQYATVITSSQACTNWTYGETEDYTVNIIAATPCTTPSAQPSGLSLTAATVSQVNGSFTAASPAPDKYLVVMYPSGATPVGPSNGTTYVVGSALGTGTIVQSSALTTFSLTCLTPGTAYDFYLYSFNYLCSGGPLYQTTAPLFGTVSTAGIVQPTALILNAISTSQINGSFTAASNAPDGYVVVRYISGATATNPVNGIIYTAGATLGAGKVVAAGTYAITSPFSVTGLFPNTSYDFYVYSYSCATSPVYLIPSPLFGTMATQACGGLAGGTYSVGPTGVYTTLTAAVAASNAGSTGPLIFELQATYVSSVEPSFPIIFNPNPCISPINSLTIRPEAGANGLIITSATASVPVFRFNGGNYITIDGRPGGVGGAITVPNTTYLQIRSTVATGSAIQFQNESSNNTIQYCDLQAMNTVLASNALSSATLSGVVSFNGTTGANGNDNNTINGCNIHVFSGGTLGIGIAAAGTTTTVSTYNDNNNITNNNIYDAFIALSATAGVDIAGGNSAWTLSGNSFFQTATRTITGAVTNRAIWVTPNLASLTPQASGFVINGNYIGGTAPLCGSTAMTLTGAVAHLYVAMDLSTGLGTATSVQSNTIQNIALTTTSSGSGNFCGISVSNGNNNVGTTTGNLIGSSTNATSILVTENTTSAGIAIGLRTIGGTGTTDNVANNTICGIKTTTSAVTVACNLDGMLISGGANVNVTGNTIGSNTLANALWTSQAVTTVAQSILGISITSATAGAITVNNNMVANLTNAAANTTITLASLTRGITSSSSIVTQINGNTISGLMSAAPNTNTLTSEAIIGIQSTGAFIGLTIAGNTISGLNDNNAGATSTTNPTTITGIYWTGAASGTNLIRKNSIYNTGFTAANTGAILNGIEIGTAGLPQLINNVIRLGYDASGNPITTSQKMRGIIKGTNSGTKIWFNSIYIGGSGIVATAGNHTYALSVTAINAADDIENNIFDNVRQNSGASAVYNASIGINALTGCIINYNVNYYTGSNNNVFAYNTALSTSIAAWSSGWFAGDLNSIGSGLDPQYIAPTATIPDLHISFASATPVEGLGTNIASVTDDKDGLLRASFSPTDVGAYCGNYIAYPFGCTGTPNPGNTNASTNPVCPNVNFTLSLQNNPAVTGFSYQWYSSTDNITFNPVAGATNITYTANQTVETWYYCDVTCGNSGLDQFSNTVDVTMASFLNCYCTPTISNFLTGMGISSFSTTLGVTNITNNGTATGVAYTNYTAQSASQIQGTSINFSVSSPGTYAQGYAIWVDWNHNGIFTDAGEAVWNSATTSTTAFTGSFTVPLSSIGGNTVMRVRSNYSALPTDPCALQSYGEAEDYTFNVIIPTPCSGPPAPGNAISSTSPVCSGVSFTLSLQNALTSTGLTFQWYSSPNNSTFSAIAGATSRTYTTSQTAETWYYCVVTCTNTNDVVNSGTLDLQMSNFRNCYCIPTISNLLVQMGIANFSTTGGVTNITNNGTATGIAYTDFTAQSISQVQGASFNFSVYAGSTTYAQGYAIWIDYNHNGVFTDPGEAVWNSGTTTTVAATGTITIPFTALLGNTTMRVRSNYSALPTDPCALQSYGEAEDYTLTVNLAPPCTGAVAGTASSNVSATFCNSGSATLSISGSNTGSQIVYQWQSSPTGNTGSFSNIAGASTLVYNTPTITVTTYYRCVVTCMAANVGDTSTAVTLNVNNPQILTTSATSHCGPGVDTLQASSSNGTTIKWYTTASGGTSIATGSPYITSTLSSTTNYYVAATTGSGTLNGLGNTSIPPDNSGWTAQRGIVFTATSVPFTIISAQYYSSTLNVTNSVTVTLQDQNGTTLQGPTTLSIVQGSTPGWYTMNLNWPITVAASGYRMLASFTSTVQRDLAANYSLSTYNNLSPVGVITSGYNGAIEATSYNYFHNISISAGCEGSRTLVPAVITAPPTLSVTSNQTICPGGIAKLDVLSNIPDFTSYIWTPSNNLYTDSLATIPYSAGSNATTLWFKTNTGGTYPITVNASNSTTSCTNSANTAVQVNIPSFSSVTASPNSVCSGANVSLNASSSTAVSYIWSPGNLTGSSVVVNPTSTTSYTVTAANSAGCTNSATVSVNVGGTPVVVSGVSGGLSSGICLGNSVTMTASASGSVSPYTYLWSNGGNTTSITTSPSSTTIYTVTITDACGTTSTANDTVIVNNPQVLSTTGGSRCGTGTVNLQATGSSGATLNWYAAASGGTPIATGSPFTTPVIASTTSYYVSAANGGGVSNVGPTTIGAVPIAGFGTTSYGIIFTATSSFTLQSVVMYPNGTGAGTVNIGLYNATVSGTAFTQGALNQSTIVNAVGTSQSPLSPQTVALNFVITPGTYFMTPISYTGSISALMFESTCTSSCAYPWTVPGCSIIGSTYTTTVMSSLYYYFYNWTITSGCESSRQSVTATVTNAPVVNVSPSTTLCSGNSLVLTASSSNDPNYTYVWTPGNVTGASANVSPSATTTYTVTGTDNTGGPNAGCANVATSTITVNQSPVVTVSASPTSVCQGNSSQLTATGSGSGSLPSGYCTTGLYTTGCSFPDVITNVSFSTINNNTGTTCNQSGTNPGYFLNTTPNPVLIPGNTYSLTIATGGDVEGAAAWIDYNGNGQFTDVGETVLNPSLAGTNPATYTVSVTIPSNATPGLTLLRCRCIYNTTAITPCVNTTYGEVEDYYVTIAGGSFAWSPATGLNTTTGSSPIATPSSSTTYTVVVTGANGCTGTGTVAVTVTPPPTASFASVGVTCNGGSNGSAAVTVNGGSAPYTYAWSNGTTTTSASPSNSITGLTSGNYTVTITSGSCTFTQSNIIVSQPSALIINKSVNNVSCFGAGNGSITVTASGGVAGYSYSWSNGSTSSAITGLGVNFYSLTVTDQSGCSAVSTTQITQPTALVVNASVGSNTTCFGGTNGTATVSASGGTPPYTGAGTITGLSAGPYTFTVTDSRGCTAVTNSITIGQPPAITATATVLSNVSCHGGNNGSVSVSAVGGTGPYTGGGTFSFLVSGVYTFNVTDANGCTGACSATVTEPAALAPNAGSNTPVCAGSNINLTSSPSGGTAGYNYAWTGPNGFASTDQNPVIPSAAPSNAGTYTLTVTDAHNCSSTVTTSVVVPICQTGLTLKLYFEGYYVGSGLMNPVMFNEGVIGATTSQCDTITVELHSATSPYGLVDSVRKVILMADGTTSVNFGVAVAGNSYYIAIKHRNSVQTWSKLPYAFATTGNSYDFSTAASQAYGNNEVEVDFSPATWAIYTGDINQDCNIDLIDFPALDFGINHGLFGYYAADLNGDGNVDLLDFPVLDANINSGIFCQFP